VNEASGHAFHSVGLSRASLTINGTGVGRKTLVLVSNIGYQGCIGSINYHDGTSMVNTAMNVSQYATGNSATTPTSGRAMKSSIGVINTSPSLNSGGRVFVLQTSARMFLPQAMPALSAAEFDALFETIIDHPSTKSLSGSELLSGRHWINLPADPTDYRDFRPWIPADQNTFLNSLTVYGAGTYPPHPMTMTWIAFDVPPLANTYELTARAHWYTRWPHSAVPSLHQKSIPTDSSGMVNGAIRAVETVGVLGTLAAGVRGVMGALRNPTVAEVAEDVIELGEIIAL
jgi:hypothetical protein